MKIEIRKADGSNEYILFGLLATPAKMIRRLIRTTKENPTASVEMTADPDDTENGVIV